VCVGNVLLFYALVRALLLAHGLRQPPEDACDSDEANLGTRRASVALCAEGGHADQGELAVVAPGGYSLFC
jgi:hypothetical protein